MRLIDADRLEAHINRNGVIPYDELAPDVDMKTIIDLGVENTIRRIIDEQPTIFPLFSGRSSGKKLVSEYLAMCHILDDYGLNSLDPVDTLRFVLEQYQKVICECTGCQLSKLSYDASTVISAICDRCTEEQQIETEDNNI